MPGAPAPLETHIWLRTHWVAATKRVKSVKRWQERGTSGTLRLGGGMSGSFLQSEAYTWLTTQKV